MTTQKVIQQTAKAWKQKVLSFLFLSVISFGCLTQDGIKMSSSMINIEIDQAIALLKSEKHKKYLLDFKYSQAQAESITATSHSAHFELIVSHPSTEDYSGGAEQYFLNKATGDIKMGWHESPMQLKEE